MGARMADANISDITSLTVQLLSAYVSRNDVPSDSLADLIKSTRAALEQGPKATEADAGRFEPAVSVRKSLASDDHIISLIDGKRYKTLKRHLSSHGLTPDQYRERYNLPKTYPTVAKSYSEARRIVASKSGLGRKATAAAPKAAHAETVIAPAQAAPVEAKPTDKSLKATSAPEAATPAANNNGSQSDAPATAATKKTATKKTASPKSVAHKPVAAQTAVEKAKAQTVEPNPIAMTQEKKSPRVKTSAKGSETIVDQPSGTAQTEKPIAPKTKAATTKVSNRKRLSIATSAPQAKDKAVKSASTKNTARPVNLNEAQGPAGNEPAVETTAS